MLWFFSLVFKLFVARLHNNEFSNYYSKKFNEVTKYQHKRALALSSRKLVRLIHSLLRDNRLYQE